MALSVVDRIPTYPGRVTLTLVAGNVYTLARADEPSVVGTPINKALFDAVDAEIVAVAPLVFYDKEVLVADWDADAVYTGWAYRASVPCTGALDEMVPTVSFAPVDIATQNLAPFSISYDGGVYVYARTVPAATITIPSIVFTKVVA